MIFECTLVCQRVTAVRPCYSAIFPWACYGNMPSAWDSILRTLASSFLDGVSSNKVPSHLPTKVAFLSSRPRHPHMLYGCESGSLRPLLECPPRTLRRANPCSVRSLPPRMASCFPLRTRMLTKVDLFWPHCGAAPHAQCWKVMASVAPSPRVNAILSQMLQPLHRYRTAPSAIGECDWEAPISPYLASKHG